MGQVRVLTRLEELSAVAAAWKVLGGDHLTRSWEFQRCWIEHFASVGSLRILVSEFEGRINGILPLVEERRLWTGRTLVNVGAGKACLDDLGIVAVPEDAPTVAKSLAQFLLHSKELQWDYLTLDGIRPSDPAMQVFAHEFTQNYAGSVERRADQSCWVVELQADSEGYHQWPKRLRRLLRKAREEERQGDLKVHYASNLQEALSELEVMESIHQARWQERGIDGCFSTEQFGRFTKSLLTETFDSGTTFIAVLRWKGKPAAGAICFRDSETLYIYLASMSPEFPKEKPGWKLNGFLADHGLRLGCRKLDLMRGDEEYKGRMGAMPVAQEKWMIASPKFWGRVHRTLYRTAREIKHFIIAPTAISTTTQMPEAAANYGSD